MLQRMAALEKRLGAVLVARQPGKKPAVRKTAKTKAPHPVGPGKMSKVSARSGPSGLRTGPSSSATTRRAQIIEEDEYIQDVNGSVAFSGTAFPVNPGLFSCLPWGSKIASLYEEYEFESLEFYYKRVVSEYASNGQAGKVMLSFDYDSLDLLPTSKQQVEDTVPHVDGMPCEPVLRLKIDCQLLRKNPCKFVRIGQPSGQFDLKTYDAGQLLVSTQGNFSNAVIGELHVRYRLALKKPVLTNNLPTAGYLHFSCTNPTTANNFSTALVMYGSSPSLTNLITIGTNQLIWNYGTNSQYLVYFVVGGSNVIGPSYTTVGGCSTNFLFTAAHMRDQLSVVYSGATTWTNCNQSSICITSGTSGGALTLATPFTITDGGVGALDCFIVAMPQFATVAVKERLGVRQFPAASGPYLVSASAAAPSLPISRAACHIGPSCRWSRHGEWCAIAPGQEHDVPRAPPASRSLHHTSPHDSDNEDYPEASHGVAPTVDTNH
jgi:hypothetical protein